MHNVFLVKFILMVNILKKILKIQFIISKNRHVLITALPKTILELYIKMVMELKKIYIFPKYILKRQSKRKKKVIQCIT